MRLLIALLAIQLSACGTIANRVGFDDPYSHGSSELPYPRNKIYGGVASDIYYIKKEHRSETSSNIPLPLDLPLSFILDTLLLPLTIYEELSQSPLPNAAENGERDRVVELIKNGKDINIKDVWQHTGLMSASWAGHTDVVQTLLEHGAAVNVKTRSGMTALLYTTKKGHTKIVQKLLAHGADPNTIGPSNSTPLSWAAGGGHTKIVNLLIERGARINIKTDHDWTPLLSAAFDGHLDVVKVLLSKGADVNAQENGGRTSLYWAACHGHEETVKVLLENGADVHLAPKPLTPDGPWNSLLNCAENNQHKSIVEILKKAGAK